MQFSKGDIKEIKRQDADSILKCKNFVIEYRQKFLRMTFDSKRRSL